MVCKVVYSFLVICTLQTDLKISGDLEISIRYRLPQTLIVNVHSANNLTNRYENGAPNPFVKIAIPGVQSVFKTKVMRTLGQVE